MSGSPSEDPRQPSNKRESPGDDSPTSPLDESLPQVGASNPSQSPSDLLRELTVSMKSARAANLVTAEQAAQTVIGALAELLDETTHVLTAPESANLHIETAFSRLIKFSDIKDCLDALEPPPDGQVRDLTLPLIFSYIRAAVAAVSVDIQTPNIDIATEFLKTLNYLDVDKVLMSFPETQTLLGYAAASFLIDGDFHEANAVANLANHSIVEFSTTLEGCLPKILAAEIAGKGRVRASLAELPTIHDYERLELDIDAKMLRAAVRGFLLINLNTDPPNPDALQRLGQFCNDFEISPEVVWREFTSALRELNLEDQNLGWITLWKEQLKPSPPPHIFSAGEAFRTPEFLLELAERITQGFCDLTNLVSCNGSAGSSSDPLLEAEQILPKELLPFIHFDNIDGTFIRNCALKALQRLQHPAAGEADADVADEELEIFNARQTRASLLRERFMVTETENREIYTTFLVQTELKLCQMILNNICEGIKNPHRNDSLFCSRIAQFVLRHRWDLSSRLQNFKRYACEGPIELLALGRRAFTVDLGLCLSAHLLQEQPTSAIGAFDSMVNDSFQVLNLSLEDKRRVFHIAIAIAEGLNGNRNNLEIRDRVADFRRNFIIDQHELSRCSADSVLREVRSLANRLA